MKLIVAVFIVGLLVQVVSSIPKRSLPLNNYQELRYSDFEFKQTSRVKRDSRQSADLNSSPLISSNNLQFTAFGRTFKIWLRRDPGHLSDRLDIEFRYSASKRPSEHFNSQQFADNFYSGYVEDEPGSRVICYFERAAASSSAKDQFQPLVYVQISIHNDQENSLFYVEPLVERDESGDPILVRYIVYKSDDIDSPVIAGGVFNQTVCQPKHVVEDEETISRRKRQLDIKPETEAIKGDPNLKNRCHLALVADHRFYQEIGNGNGKLTVAYMMNVIAAVNSIYLNTVWALKGSDEGDADFPRDNLTDYGFTIDKIRVEAEPHVTSYEHFNNANSSTNADRILELFGQEDWTSYCLAHLFTFQSFENSVLGLAYVSSPLPYSLGGICSQPTRSGSRKQFSVNTGLSSFKSVSYKQGRLLQREAELVTAHEFGHNWGSEHDPLKAECTPTSSNGGNYIMYAYSNQGHERNNYYFSPCSKNSIFEVLKSKAKCFKGEALSFCGNDRIEENEECDAGLAGRQGIDPCCDYNCKLRPGAQCSDSNHNCCRNCKIAASNVKCYSSPNFIECLESFSLCDGVSKDCPPQKPKRENSTCQAFDQGRCSARGQCLSLCQQIDMSLYQCKCPVHEEKCMICCQNIIQEGADQSSCRPISKIFPNYYPSAQYMTNGRPCYDGLCENQICKQKVKDYVSRFWRVIETVTVSGFVEFMKRNIVGSIIVISLIFWVPISCCIHFCVDKRNWALADQYRKEIILRQRAMNEDEKAHMFQETPM